LPTWPDEFARPSGCSELEEGALLALGQPGGCAAVAVRGLTLQFLGFLGRLFHGV
jgi:hypothetical protein